MLYNSLKYTGVLKSNQTSNLSRSSNNVQPSRGFLKGYGCVIRLHQVDASEKIICFYSVYPVRINHLTNGAISTVNYLNYQQLIDTLLTLAPIAAKTIAKFNGCEGFRMLKKKAIVRSTFLSQLLLLK